jgi:hypothetical protein
VCKLKKTLYGLKQAPRAWYSRLDKYLQQQDFKIRISDNNLYIKTIAKNQLIFVFYVDDIIFGGGMKEMCQEFSIEMKKEF